jgi:hypothetical protein
MEIKRLVLVLVDISGYTNFIKMHTMSLLHAESIVTDLLEAVIDHAEYPLTLSKLEGDAAFLYAALDDEGEASAAAKDILNQVTKFFEAFRAKERALIACDVCRCDACDNIEQLKLKAFLHVGETVIKKIRQFEELAGENVILIHRLLKNSIPVKEYILLTEAFHELSGGFAGSPAETRTEACEGIGQVTVRVYYPPSDELPLPPRPAPGPPTPGTEIGEIATRWNDYAVQRITGQTPRPNFSHLPQAKLTRLSLWSYFVVGVGGNIIATIRHRLGPKA